MQSSLHGHISPGFTQAQDIYATRRNLILSGLESSRIGSSATFVKTFGMKYSDSNTLLHANTCTSGGLVYATGDLNRWEGCAEKAPPSTHL